MKFSKIKLTFLFAVILAVMVSAVPQQPAAYWGYVTVDGQIVSTGTTVWVEDAYGNVVGNATSGTLAGGLYSLNVGYVDNPPTTDQSGNHSDNLIESGEDIIFYVAGISATTRIVDSAGSNTQLNLSVSDSSAPTTPTSLSATEVSAGVINLTWTAATDDFGVQKYLVYRSTSTGLTKSTGTNIGNTTNLFYTDTGLTLDGSTYYYVVTAMDTSNEGSESNEANKTVSDTTPPSAPTGLTVTDVSGEEGQLQINWNANVESDFANYTLYFSSDNSTFTAETQTTSTSYTDTSLTDGNTYYYKVMAMDESGNPSTNSSVVAGTPTDTKAPTIVTGLNAVDTSNAEDSATISWTASASADTAGYLLFRDGTQVANLPGKTNVSYIDTGVTDGTSYTYAVSAYDEVPNYAANVTDTVTPVDDLFPKPVSGLSVSASNHTVNLTWVAVTQNTDNSAITDLTGYIVYQNVSGTWTLVQQSTVTRYDAGNLTNLQVYQYKVAAYDDAGNIGANVSVSATPSERPTISSSVTDGTAIKSSQTINVSITSGQNLDVAYYRVYNSTGQQVDAGLTNTSIGATSIEYEINPSTWAEGIVHLVYTFANDTNGQYTQTNFTYTVDDTPPTVSGQTASQTLVTSTTALLLNVTVTDASSITSVTAGNDSSVSMAGNGDYSVLTNASALGCSEGTCFLTFTATDQAGNSNTATLTITVDDTAPTLSNYFMTDADSNGVINKWVLEQINVTAIDQNGVTSVSVGNGSLIPMINVSATEWTVNVTGLSMGCPDGICGIRFVATDSLGNINSSYSFEMLIDNYDPIINSVVLSDDYVKNSTQVSVTVNVSDNVSNVTDVTAEQVLLVNQGNGIWNGTITLIDKISNIVDVRAHDSADNEAENNLTSYTIDDTAPLMVSISLSDQYVQEGTDVTLTMNLSDEGLILYRYAYFWGNGSAQSGTLYALPGNESGVFTETLTLSGQLDNITIYASDYADNVATYGFINGTDFFVDDTALSINSVSISDGYVKTGQSVLVTANVTDLRLESVTANGVAMINTSADQWIANITILNASGVVTIYAEDSASNNVTDNSTTFVVDNIAPVITVEVPGQGSIYSSPVTFNFTVNDTNLTRVNLSLDYGKQTWGDTSVGTKTPAFSFRAGQHIAEFSAIDEAGNTATVIRRNFTVNAPLNVTEVAREMTSVFGSQLKNLTVKANNTDVTGNDSVDANQTMTMEIELNVSGTRMNAEIRDFNGLGANWENTFGADVNQSASRGLRVTSNAGSTVQNMLLFLNATNFLSDFTNGAVITFDSPLGDLDVLFIEDDEVDSVFKLSGCTSVPTGAITTSNMCYTNTSTNVTLYIPHFSGGALANDTSAPGITINNPLNLSTQADSFFTLNFSATEANPATTGFCNYTLKNGTTIMSADYAIETDDMEQVGTKYTYAKTLDELSDGIYTLKVSCKDQNAQSSSAVHTLTVADTTEPQITSIDTSSRGSQTVTVTLEVETNEDATCRYKTSNVAFSSMQSMDVSGNRTHSVEIQYTTDESGTYYVRCNDTAGNIMSGTNSTTFNVNVKVAGNGGGGASTGSSSTTQFAKTFSKILAGETKTIDIDKDTYDGVPFYKMQFKTENELTDSELKVKTLTAAATSTGKIEFEAYKYIQITETNIAQGDLTNTIVWFRVEKSWLESKGITKDNIALFRYTNDAWTLQTTTLESEDSTFAYYKATTGGYSYFAIGQKEEQASTTEITGTTNTTNSNTTNKNTTNTGTDNTPTGGAVTNTNNTGNSTPGNDNGTGGISVGVWILLLLLILAGIAFFMYKKGFFEVKSDEDKLKKFVEKKRAKGETDEEIKAELKSVGWKSELIEQAFK